MAAILGVGVPRLRQMVGEGMPRAGVGLYPLTGCVRWYIEFWRSRAQAAMNPRRDRAEDARITILEAKALEATGHLVHKADVKMALDAAFMVLGRSLETLPGQLGRECQLPPEAVRKMRARFDDFRKNLARDCAKYMTEKRAEIAGAKAKSGA